MVAFSTHGGFQTVQKLITYNYNINDPSHENSLVIVAARNHFRGQGFNFRPTSQYCICCTFILKVSLEGQQLTKRSSLILKDCMNTDDISSESVR
jgi:hypothetical protein